MTFHGPSGPTVSLELKVIGHGVAACDNATHDVSEASVASLFEIIFAEKGCELISRRQPQRAFAHYNSRRMAGTTRNQGCAAIMYFNFPRGHAKPPRQKERPLTRTSGRC